MNYGITFDNLSADLFYATPSLIAIIGLFIYIKVHKQPKRINNCLVQIIIVCVLLMTAGALERSACVFESELRSLTDSEGFEFMYQYCEVHNLDMRPYVFLRTVTAATGYSLRPAIFMLFGELLSKEIPHKWLLLYRLPCVLCLLLYFTSFKTHWCFYFDTSFNYFWNGGTILNYINYLIGFMYAVFALIKTIHYSFRKNPGEFIFSVFIFLSIYVAVIGDKVMSDLNNSVINFGILTPTIVICSVFYFLSVKTNYYEDTIEHNEVLLRDKDNELRISQIQPHFIFNTLTTIIDLCPEGSKAQEALFSFSHYLRVNIDSLGKHKIPFTEELRHIETFIDLERYSYENKLLVNYDLEVLSFYVPALSLQPLVENAVKYSLRAHEEVRILIRTVIADPNYIITIEDDGPGMNAMQSLSEDKKHVGIENIRYRLDKISHARLVYEVPETGRGTLAKVVIPKGDAENENIIG